MKAYNMQGYKIIRTQFFASASMTSVSISPNGIRFSAACIRKFADTEHIELKVHPHNQSLAVIPCTERSKTKMCWARMRGGGISVRTINAAAFLHTLYELFGWDKGKRYRLRGEIIGRGKEVVAMFDVHTPEIFSSRYEYEMPWATEFGEDFSQYMASRPVGVYMAKAFSEYSNEPSLRPTPFKTAGNNVRMLVNELLGSGV